MILGQSAATAAMLALAAASSVQHVPYATLRARLLADGQLLTLAAARRPARSLSTATTRRGHPGRHVAVGSTSIGGYYGPDYEHDGNTAKGVNRLRFTPTLPSAGTYTVYLRWTAHPNRASNVPVDIVHSGGVTNRARSTSGQRRHVGVPRFATRSPPARAGSVLIRTENTNGYVVADAARFVAA